MKRILMVLFLLPSAAFAQGYFEDTGDEGIRYTWFGVGHTSAQLEAPGEDVDAGGWKFDISFTVRDHVHLWVDTQSLELDDFEDVSARQTTFGIGTHFDVAEKLSVFGRFGHVNVSGEDSVGSVEDDGLRAIAGARYMPWDGWEFRAGVDYVDLDTAGDDTGGFVGTDMWLTEVISLTGDLEFRDGGDSVVIGARLYFGE